MGAGNTSEENAREAMAEENNSYHVVELHGELYRIPLYGVECPNCGVDMSYRASDGRDVFYWCDEDECDEEYTEPLGKFKMDYEQAIKYRMKGYD